MVIVQMFVKSHPVKLVCVIIWASVRPEAPVVEVEDVPDPLAKLVSLSQ